MTKAPETIANLAYAWGQHEASGTNRAPIHGERKAREFIEEEMRKAKADAWEEGHNEPQDCCGLCPARSCPWDGGGRGPTNPYRT